MLYTSEMASILIRDIPLALHERLREAAARDHRSLNKEIVALLEAALDRQKDTPPAPLQAGFCLDADWLEKAVAEGRE
jgi:plasmid stability protein